MEPTLSAAAAEAATTTVKNIRDLNWDTPYRYLASALGIAAIVGIWTKLTPLASLASVPSVFHAYAAADWLQAADHWAALMLPPAVWWFALILAACLAVNVTDPDENPIVAAESRATATGWVTVAAIAYCAPGLGDLGRGGGDCGPLPVGEVRQREAALPLAWRVGVAVVRQFRCRLPVASSLGIALGRAARSVEGQLVAD